MEQFDSVAEASFPSEAPSILAARDLIAGAGHAALDSMSLEPVMLNLEHSIKVHGKHQFFSWAQGLLQNIVPHDLLVCATRTGLGMSFNVDCFSTTPDEPGRFGDLFRRDPSIVANLATAWEKNSFFPLFCAADDAAPAGGVAFWRELQRMGATRVVAHGTHDASSRAQSLFIFASRPASACANRESWLQLIVPSLHAAWVRTQLAPSPDSSASRPAASGGLTNREQEILKWVYHGKSNYEIGVILSISPLTVKNHVQKILRKLNVQNRTQAVGKAIELRVLIL